MAQQITTSKRLIHNTLFNVAALVSNAVVVTYISSWFLSLEPVERRRLRSVLGRSKTVTPQ